MSDKERKDERLSPDGPSILSRPISEKLENFWYHYKWHTLIALFIVFVVTICTLQMCSKAKYDVYVLYAGDEYIDHKSTNGDIPPYNTIHSAIESFAGDYDKDNKVSVVFTSKYSLSEEELAELEASLSPGEELNYPLISSNSKELGEMMLYSEYFLCFLSPAMYEQYKGSDELMRFVDLTEIAKEGEDVALYSEDAILLNSLDAYKDTGLSLLPEDTVVCLRAKSNVLRTSANKYFEPSLELLKSIIAYSSPKS